MLNVTSKDHENEAAILKTLCDDHGFSVIGHYTDDYTSHFDAKIVSPNGNTVLAELRWRTRYSGEGLNKKDGAYLNCDKYWATVKEARNQKAFYGIFVMCSDGLWFRDIYDPKWSDDDAKYKLNQYSVDNPRRHDDRGQSLNDSCFAYMIRVKRCDEYWPTAKMTPVKSLD